MHNLYRFDVSSLYQQICEYFAIFGSFVYQFLGHRSFSEARTCTPPEMTGTDLGTDQGTDHGTDHGRFGCSSRIITDFHGCKDAYSEQETHWFTLHCCYVFLYVLIKLYTNKELALQLRLGPDYWL